MAENRHSAESAHEETTMELLRAAMQRTVETFRAAMQTMRDDLAWAQATQPPAYRAQRQADASWDAMADRAADPDALADLSHGQPGPTVIEEDGSRPGASLGRNESEMGPAISEARAVTTFRAWSQRGEPLRAPAPSRSQERQRDQGRGQERGD